MDLSMIKMQLCMLCMLAVGFICGKRKMLSAEGRREITDIFVKVILPCNVLSSFCEHVPFEKIKTGLPIIVIYSLVLISAWLLGRIIYRKFEPGQKKIFIYSTIVSNAHFLGFPVIQALWGSEAIIYASMALIPIVFFTWTLGLSQFVAVSKAEGVKAFLTHPCFIALLIGMLLTAFQADIPGPIAEAITRFGNCVMPISVLLIGTMLADIELKGLFDWRNILGSAVRLLVLPLLTLLVLRLLGVSEEIVRVTVIMVAMPVAIITAILAEQYKADVKCASQLVFLSTAASLFTLPAIYYFL